MLDTFLDHLDVLWGFLVSFAIVVVITPAVGRLARVLGVVDEPGEQRRMHLRAVPRLGGLGLFLGFFVAALAFVDLDGPYRGILLGAALATTRLLQSLLFEVQPTDPGTLIAVAVGLVLLAAVASWLPARRAMRVDPVEALRTQ